MFFFNSSKALIPMFHMMMALVISAAITDFANERGQSSKKLIDVAKVDQRV